jgi:hypothetical protein
MRRARRAYRKGRQTSSIAQRSFRNTGPGERAVSWGPLRQNTREEDKPEKREKSLLCLAIGLVLALWLTGARSSRHRGLNKQARFGVRMK